MLVEESFVCSFIFVTRSELIYLISDLRKELRIQEKTRFYPMEIYGRSRIRRLITFLNSLVSIEDSNNFTSVLVCFHRRSVSSFFKGLLLNDYESRLSLRQDLFHQARCFKFPGVLPAKFNTYFRPSCHENSDQPPDSRPPLPILHSSFKSPSIPHPGSEQRLLSDPARLSESLQIYVEWFFLCRSVMDITFQVFLLLSVFATIPRHVHY